MDGQTSDILIANAIINYVAQPKMHKKTKYTQFLVNYNRQALFYVQELLSN